MKQYFYSEILNKAYDTAEECDKAEKEYLDAKKAEEEKKEALTKERKERADEVNAAFEAARQAIDNYNKLLDKFVKDYKGYNVTIRNTSIDDIFNNFWRLF